MPEQKKDEIRVEDKRHFDREGNVLKHDEPPETAQPSMGGPESEQQAEKVDFISVLFSYVHTAMIYLGDVEDPLQKKTDINLEGARQMIDILELVQEKTKGNLTDRETQYLQSALYDLRMRYMKKAKLIG